MTAQIAVFNLNGVAVASDSTTTVSNPERTRTVSGAQKLFELGPAHRVVAMTSGEARFMRVPYTVLIPRWRESLTAPPAHVEAYARQFLASLPTQGGLFGPEGQDRLWKWMLEDYYLMVRSRLHRQLKEHDLQDTPWDHAAVGNLVTDSVLEMVAALESRDDLHEVDLEADRAFFSAQAEIVTGAFDYVFDTPPRPLRQQAGDLAGQVGSRAPHGSRGEGAASSPAFCPMSCGSGPPPLTATMTTSQA